MGNHMAEPENHTLHLLRELRDDVKALDGSINALDRKVDRNHEELKEHIDSLREVMAGESVLGRYATAGFDDRLTALERRVSALENR